MLGARCDEDTHRREGLEFRSMVVAAPGTSLVQVALRETRSHPSPGQGSPGSQRWFQTLPLPAEKCWRGDEEVTSDPAG